MAPHHARHGEHPTDHERIRHTIIAYDPDFVVLLEVTPWLLDHLADLADRYPYRAAEPREDNFGIALFSRRPFLRADIVQFSAAGLPSIIAGFAADGRRFTLLGTHPLPPVGAGQAQDRNDQLARLAAENALSVYDAAYLELALRLKIPLACKDGPLREAAKRRRFLQSYPKARYSCTIL